MCSPYRQTSDTASVNLGLLKDSLDGRLYTISHIGTGGGGLAECKNSSLRRS
jgi:hypothetical protein